MADKKKQSQELQLRDKKLLDAAANGYSGVELEQVTGIPAAQAIARVRELLASRDIFDEIERKKLIMYSAYKLKEKIEDYDAQVDVKNPKAAEAYLKVLQAIDDMLARQGRITEDEMAAAARAQAEMMSRFIIAAYMRVREWILEEYPNLVRIDEVDQIFEIGLREATLEDE